MIASYPKGKRILFLKHGIFISNALLIFITLFLTGCSLYFSEPEYESRHYFQMDRIKNKRWFMVDIRRNDTSYLNEADSMQIRYWEFYPPEWIRVSTIDNNGYGGGYIKVFNTRSDTSFMFIVGTNHGYELNSITILNITSTKIEELNRKDFEIPKFGRIGGYYFKISSNDTLVLNNDYKNSILKFVKE